MAARGKRRTARLAVLALLAGGLAGIATGATGAADGSAAPATGRGQDWPVSDRVAPAVNIAPAWYYGKTRWVFVPAYYNGKAPWGLTTDAHTGSASAAAGHIRTSLGV
jgi:hypothetical protein